MKKLRKFLPAVIAIVLAFTLIFSVACHPKGNDDNPPAEKTLTGITLNTDNVKKAYTVGDDFTSAGLVVTANYSDTTTETVSLTDPDLAIDSSAYSKTTAGTYTIKVTYKTKEASYTVTVADNSTPPPAQKTLSSISLDYSSAKTDYKVGEAFSSAGLVVTANYSDTTTETVALTDPDLKIDSTAFKKDEVGVYTIKVTYKGQNAAYDVTVSKSYYGANVVLASDVVAGITLSADKASGDIVLSQETKTVTIDSSKIEVRKPSSNGEVDMESTPLAATEYTVSVFKGKDKVEELSNLGAGVYQIWVTLNDKVDGHTLEGFALIYVIDNLDTLTINSDAKLEQTVGANTIVPTWKFTATYTSGATEDVTASVKYDPAVNTGSAGEKSTTVSYTTLNQKGVEVTKDCIVNYTINAASGPVTSETYTVEYKVVTTQRYVKDSTEGIGSLVATWSDDKQDANSDNISANSTLGNYNGKDTDKTASDGKAYHDYGESKTGKYVSITLGQDVKDVTITAYVSHTSKNSTRTAYLTTKQDTFTGAEVLDSVEIVGGASAPANLEILTASNLGAGTYYVQGSSDTVHVYAVIVTYTVSVGSSEPVQPSTYTAEYKVVTTQRYVKDSTEGIGSLVATWSDENSDPDISNLTVTETLGNYNGKDTDKSATDGKAYHDYGESKNGKYVCITLSENVENVTITAYVSHTSKNSTRKAYITTKQDSVVEGDVLDSVEIVGGASAPANLEILTASNLGAGTYYIQGTSDTIHIYAVIITYTVKA